VAVATVLDAVSTAEDAGDGLGVGEVLLLEDASLEGSDGIAFFDGDGTLENDDAVIDGFVNKVDGAASDFDSELQCLFLRVEAGEGRQQRRVDVEDAVGEGGDELRRDDAHVACETDEIDVVLVKVGDHLGVVLGALAASGGDAEGGDAELAGSGEAGSVVDVGEDDGDLHAEEPLVADGLGDGEEVGASAGEEDT
jgi:hypothetical protein